MTVSGLTITGEWRPSGHRQDRMIQKILSDIRGDGRDLFRFRTVIEDGPNEAARVPPIDYRDNLVYLTLFSRGPFLL